MNVKVNNPNFSIVVPGKCDSSCQFCFGSDKKLKKIGRIKYLKKLRDTLDGLPPYFTQISITGGEPTLSPLLEDILHSIDKDRFPKLVLTTTATKNGNLLGTRFIDKVDHINISRHSIDDEENRKIFCNNDIPDKEELKELITELNIAGIDVTLSCVLREKVILDELFRARIIQYIKFAKEVNATACQFRKNQTPDSDLNPTRYELAFSEYQVVHRNECPVCRSETKYIDGMSITWRASLFEPSNEWNGIYELIFQPDGIVTSDWAGENEIDIVNSKEDNAKEMDMNELLDGIYDDGVVIEIMPCCGSGKEPTKIIKPISNREPEFSGTVGCGHSGCGRKGGKSRIRKYTETVPIEGCGRSGC